MRTGGNFGGDFGGDFGGNFGGYFGGIFSGDPSHAEWAFFCREWSWDFLGGSHDFKIRAEIRAEIRGIPFTGPQLHTIATAR